MTGKTLAVDVRTCHHTGMGRYVRCTLSRIAEMDLGLRLVAIANPGQDLNWLPRNERTSVHLLERPVAVYSPWEHVALPRALKRVGCDAVHFTHFNAPLRCPVPAAVTIYDTILLRTLSVAKTPLRALYSKFLMRHAGRLAAAVVTISEHSRADIEALLHVPRDRITITDCGGWTEGELPEPGPEALARARERSPYVIYVGNQNPHKNLVGLAEAVQIVRRKRPTLKLVAVGKESRHFAGLVAELRRRGLAHAVEFTGEVSDEMLVALYRCAEIVSTASLYEGFGLPVLEGFCVGVPVVASNQSCLPEVAGDAAVLADPRNPTEFAAALESVLDDPALQQELVRRGRQRAGLRKYAWDHVAERLAEVYQRVLAG